MLVVVTTLTALDLLHLEIVVLAVVVFELVLELALELVPELVALELLLVVLELVLLLFAVLEALVLVELVAVANLVTLVPRHLVVVLQKVIQHLGS